MAGRAVPPHGYYPACPFVYTPTSSESSYESTLPTQAIPIHTERFTMPNQVEDEEFDRMVAEFEREQIDRDVQEALREEEYARFEEECARETEEYARKEAEFASVKATEAAALLKRSSEESPVIAEMLADLQQVHEQTSRKQNDEASTKPDVSVLVQKAYESFGLLRSTKVKDKTIIDMVKDQIAETPEKKRNLLSQLSLIAADRVSGALCDSITQHQFNPTYAEAGAIDKVSEDRMNVEYLGSLNRPIWVVSKGQQPTNADEPVQARVLQSNVIDREVITINGVCYVKISNELANTATMSENVNIQAVHQASQNPDATTDESPRCEQESVDVKSQIDHSYDDTLRTRGNPCKSEGVFSDEFIKVILKEQNMYIEMHVPKLAIDMLLHHDSFADLRQSVASSGELSITGTSEDVFQTLMLGLIASNHFDQSLFGSFLLRNWRVHGLYTLAHRYHLYEVQSSLLSSFHNASCLGELIIVSNDVYRAGAADGTFRNMFKSELEEWLLTLALDTGNCKKSEDDSPLCNGDHYAALTDIDQDTVMAHDILTVLVSRETQRSKPVAGDDQDHDETEDEQVSCIEVQTQPEADADWRQMAIIIHDVPGGVFHDDICGWFSQDGKVDEVGIWKMDGSNNFKCAYVLFDSCTPVVSLAHRRLALGPREYSPYVLPAMESWAPDIPSHVEKVNYRDVQQVCAQNVWGPCGSMKPLTPPPPPLLHDEHQVANDNRYGTSAIGWEANDCVQNFSPRPTPPPPPPFNFQLNPPWACSGNYSDDIPRPPTPPPPPEPSWKSDEITATGSGVSVVAVKDSHDFDCSIQFQAGDTIRNVVSRLNKYCDCANLTADWYGLATTMDNR